VERINRGADRTAAQAHFVMKKFEKICAESCASQSVCIYRKTSNKRPRFFSWYLNSQRVYLFG